VEFIERVKSIYKKNPNSRQGIIAGGETTVTLGRNYGKGGRNQEFALAAAIELDRVFDNFPCKVTILSCGTDGTDGPTDAAGAIVDTDTVRHAKSMGLNPQKALEDHNAYPFFNTLGALVKTGPTNTNVMDIQIAIIDI
jgi:hydroxypyruvate reductase